LSQEQFEERISEIQNVLYEQNEILKENGQETPEIATGSKMNVYLNQISLNNKEIKKLKESISGTNHPLLLKLREIRSRNLGHLENESNHSVMNEKIDELERQHAKDSKKISKLKKGTSCLQD